MSKINLSGASSEANVIRGTDGKRPLPEKQAESAKDKTVVTDQVKFSDRAANAGKLVEKVKEVADVRLERVAELRDRIKAGEYKPTGGDIADAILKDEQ